MRSWCRDPDSRDRHLRTKLSPGRKTKVSLLTEKTNKNRCLAISDAVDIRTAVWVSIAKKFQNRSGRNSEFFSKVCGGLSASSV